MRKSLFVMLALAIILPPCTLAGQASAPAGAESVLHPGDAVRISMWRKPELSGEFAVAADGSIADAFYSAVRVADIPFSEADARIRQYLAQYETSKLVWVEPLYRITVGGEVRQPNTYLARREATLAQAVAQAGGPTASGRVDRVRLTRAGRTMIVDFTDPQSSWAHAPVRSGDEIVVERQRSFLREYVVPSASVVAAVASIIRLFLK